MAHVIINYDSHTIIIRFLPVWLTYVRTCMRLLFLYIFFFLVLAFGYDCEWHKQIAFAIPIASRCRPIYVHSKWDPSVCRSFSWGCLCFVSAAQNVLWMPNDTPCPIPHGGLQSDVFSEFSLVVVDLIFFHKHGKASGSTNWLYTLIK